jgi:hypothetical protein
MSRHLQHNARRDDRRRLALLYPGDRAARDASDPKASRFAALFEAFEASGCAIEPAVYHDAFADEVQRQLEQLDGVLVWHNPIEGGRTREHLDAMLRSVATRGVLVSTHPDTILRLGTKDVLVDVRDLPFGSDAHRVADLQDLATNVRARLARGPRVLKQHRGHSGIGVWRVERLGDERFALRHAQRGAVEEVVDFATVVARLAPYFVAGGHMVDQAWQPRMVEGMVRAYLVKDRVAGFGHQAVNALFPASGAKEAPPPGPRLYSDRDDARFQALRHRLEEGWIELLCSRVGVEPARVPLLWDVDFLLGERTVVADERYVLCEINVSSVSPFPSSAIAPLVEATGLALSAAGR